MDTTHELTESELTIASALADMAIARGGTFDDYQTPIYLRGLVDLDAALVARACEQLGLEPREDFTPVVPPVGTIRQRVERLAREDTAKAAAAKLLPLPKSEDDEPRYFCVACRDEPYGWRVFRCGGKGESAGLARGDGELYACSRRVDHYPHSYVERCACHGTNPVSAEHRRRMDEARVKRESRTR